MAGTPPKAVSSPTVGPATYKQLDGGGGALRAAGLAARLAGCFGRRRWRVDDLSAGASGAGKALGSHDEEDEELRRPAGFGDLPDHLIEGIFRHLSQSRRQYHFAICGVNTTWRRLGKALFFSTPWHVPHLICHPTQLFCLSPRPLTGSKSGLLKCFVRRETKPAGGGGTRFTLYIGRESRSTHRARFLLCAVQASRSEVHLFLNSRAEGVPVGRLAANGFATQYRLELAGVCLMPAAPSAGDSPSVAPAAADDPLPEVVVPPPPAARQPSWGPAAAEEAAAAAVRQGVTVFAELQYKARVKGFMQPRRMRVTMPHPSQLSFQQVLPQLSRAATPRDPLRQLSSASSLSSSSEGAAPPGPSPASGEGLQCASPQCPSPADPEIEPAAAAAASPPSSPFATAGQATAAEDGKARGSCEAAGLQQVGGGRMGRLLRALRLPAGAAAATGACAAASGDEGAGGASRSHAAPAAALPPAPAALLQPQLPIALRNKAPHWNDALRCWCLNFKGRVKLASVKNFQLVREDDPAERVVMQFGKVAADAYILDFNPTVLTTFQAFAICLSTFDSKIML